MNIDEYYAKFGSSISQESERLFVDEFLYPLLGTSIGSIEPQYPFIDSTGRSRRIDFACRGVKWKTCARSERRDVSCRGYYTQ